MKFTAPLAFILAAATAVSAVPNVQTNAERLARGLPPMPPRMRATGVDSARRQAPSGTPSVCPSGTNLKCCLSLKSASDSEAKVIIALLRAKDVNPDSTVGLTCVNLSNTGYAIGTCKTNTACCTKDYIGGLLSTGCSSGGTFNIYFPSHSMK